MESKLYVGNLAYSTTEDSLRALFFQAGTVSSVALIKDRDSGQSKGFAFVEMSTQVEAEKAISMFNGYQMGDRELRVSIARPREEKPRGGFDIAAVAAATVLNVETASVIKLSILLTNYSPRPWPGRIFIPSRRLSSSTPSSYSARPLP